MLHNFIYRVLERRHFWRYATFSEIAELYASRTLTVIAMHMASGFGSVYLYQQGYSLSFIMLFWACYYAFKIPLSFGAAYFTAQFGPKHGILLSNILYIPAMIALGFVPDFGFAAIVIWGVFMGLSATIYQLCYLVDFSKVKNIDHAGKEIAFMNIIEKIAVGLSPVLGGLLALWFGPQVVMWIAAFVFVIAAYPLMRTAEQTRIHQKFTFVGFPWRLAARSLVARSGMGMDVIATSIVWGLFIAISIFPNLGNEIYVTLGTLSSVALFSAIATSYAYGKLIDRSKGGELLKISVVVNSLVHLSRPFVASPLAVVGTNVANEVATAGIAMSFTRGLFDTADLSGHRIAYLCAVEVATNIGAVFASLILLACIALLDVGDGMRLFFFIVAFLVLLVGTARFRLYRK